MMAFRFPCLPGPSADHTVAAGHCWASVTHGLWDEVVADAIDPAGRCCSAEGGAKGNGSSIASGAESEEVVVVLAAGEGSALLQGMPEVHLSQKSVVEDALSHESLVEAGASRSTVVRHSSRAEAEHRHNPHWRTAAPDLGKSSVYVAHTHGVNHGGRIDTNIVDSQLPNSGHALLWEELMRMREVFFVASMELRTAVGRSTLQLFGMVGLLLLIILAVGTIMFIMSSLGRSENTSEFHYPHMHRRQIPRHDAIYRIDSDYGRDGFTPYERGVSARLQAAPLPSHPEPRNSAGTPSAHFSPKPVIPPSPVPLLEVAQSLGESDHLCPGLVVPPGNDCFLAVPRLDALPCDVCDVEGRSLVKIEVNPPVWELRGSGCPLVLLRAAQPVGSGLDNPAPEVLLAYCKSAPGPEGRQSVSIFNHRHEHFAEIRRVVAPNKVHEPSRTVSQSSYMLTSRRTGMRALFEGSFEHHRLRITNERKDEMAKTEAGSMTWDCAGAYYKLHVFSDVDVALMVCSLLSIDHMELG